VFFARYEASQLGSPEITSEHLLLGLLRDDKAVLRHLQLNIEYETVRNDVVARVQPSALKLPLHVDLPLADDAKLVLKFAMEEADRLNMRHIGTEHLLLGMLHDADFSSAKVLARLGADFESLQTRVAKMRDRFAAQESIARYSHAPVKRPSTVEIHGKKVIVDAIQITALLLKQLPFYWERRQWPRGMSFMKRTGSGSLSTSAWRKTQKDFCWSKGGWKRDLCSICTWELFDTDDISHGVGYTNGLAWVCQECYERFVAGDFFSSPYADIT
jgi:hypothetical protein